MTLKFSNGTTLTFSQPAATNLGDYVGPFVQQACLRQRAPATGDYRAAFTVFFRPDMSGARQEIVVEYGTEFKFGTLPPVAASGVKPAHITSPYTATISGSGLASPVVVTVPNHWWGARWRWQSASRAMVRGYTNLVAMKAILPLSTQALWNTSPPATGVAWNGPMETAGLASDEQDVADRPEIGFITEYQACYLLTDNAAAQQTMLSQAEAMGTMPVWVRDAATGAMFDVQTYPFMALLNDASNGSHQIPSAGFAYSYGTINGTTLTVSYAHSPFLAAGMVLQGSGAVFVPGTRIVSQLSGTPGGVGTYKVSISQTAAYGAFSAANYIITDASHFPAAAFVAWLLTDDPFHLEGAMAAGQYAMTQANYHNINEDLPGLALVSQTRGWAWGMRDLMRMAAFAPASPPSWLLPQSYWQQCVANNLTYASKFLAAKASPCSVFNLIPDTGNYQSFMVDFLVTVMGWAGWSGLFPAWARVVAYVAGPRLSMLAPPAAGGWDQRLPVPYLVPVVNANLGAGAATVDADYTVANTSETPTSWARLWTAYQVYAAKHVAGWTNPATWAANTVRVAITNMGYAAEARAACAALQLAGVAGASNAHTWLYDQLAALMPGAGSPSDYKWAIWTS